MMPVHETKTPQPLACEAFRLAWESYLLSLAFKSPFWVEPNFCLDVLADDAIGAKYGDRVNPEHGRELAISWRGFTKTLPGYDHFRRRIRGG